MIFCKFRVVEPTSKEYFDQLCKNPAVKSKHHGCGKEARLTNVSDIQVVQGPKEEEKPSLVLTIGNGTYPVFLQFSTKSNTSLEERIKQLIRHEVFSAPA